MKYWLPYNWDEKLAHERAKEEGGKLILSDRHFPVIVIDVWTDLVTQKKRAHKYIIFSEKVDPDLDPEDYFITDDFKYFEEESGFLSSTNEYRLALIAFANGARFVEIRPLCTLCKKEHDDGI